MNKFPDTKKSKEKSTGSDNGGNLKAKYSKQKKKDYQSNNNYTSSKNPPLKCT